ncbi:triacylglycerol lipase [Malassezia cuniculi]|uniref:triacylglycerol lipase n=1 Tax=Malassezia cuniculi TaxID=948313 RepID=A0AAF0ESM7_9BASI|nr:triacylglycerol lipase [Malassezia cuniculi]
MRGAARYLLLGVCFVLLYVAYHGSHTRPKRSLGTLKYTRQHVRRVSDLATYLARRSRDPYNTAVVAWEDDEVIAPDVGDRETLSTLAEMANLAYYRNASKDAPTLPGWSITYSFGWDSDGLRGHVFTSPDSPVAVTALKGTSATFLPGGGDTARRDKDNDNLFFSCCCARVTPSWTPACGCFDDDARTCDAHCVSRALIEHSLYYPAATAVYNNVSYTYPEHQLWMTGHSLGGATASLLGITFAVPTVAFEAPGERLAAARLHLPLPPPEFPDQDAFARAPVTHVYNTADPLAMGDCQGPHSLCSIAGYAMETRCHAGRSVIYDTRKYLGWSSNVLAHRLASVMELLAEDWDTLASKHAPHNETLGEVPAPVRESNCTECTDWTYI